MFIIQVIASVGASQFHIHLRYKTLYVMQIEGNFIGENNTFPFSTYEGCGAS